MATITATSSGNLDDGGFVKNGGSLDSYSNLRDSTSSTSFADNTTVINVGHGGNNSGGLKILYRGLMNFDLSSEDAGTISSGTIKLYQSAGDVASGFFTRIAQTDEYFHLAKAEAGSSFATDDFNNMTGWVSSGNYDGEVTEYAEKIAQSGSVGWKTWNLNATALSDINSALGSSSIQVMVLSSQDFTDGTFDNPYVSGFFGIHGALFSSSEAALTKPTLDITYGATATDSATFFGTNF